MNPNIDIYLRSAFKELDAFAIPKVGTFRKVHRAAQLAKEYGELRPPVLEIEFEPEVADSLLLTSYLTNNIHMGKGEAEQIVSDISLTISHALKSRKKFEIAEIGSLRRSSEGKLSFSTSHHNRSIFADDYFGLKPIQYKSPVRAIEFENSDGLVDAAEVHNVHETVGSASKGPLRIVAMLGLIIMFGITLIYTVRTERASLAVRPPVPLDLNTPPSDPNLDPIDQQFTNRTTEIEEESLPAASDAEISNITEGERISIGDAKDFFTEIIASEPPIIESPISFPEQRTRGDLPTRDTQNDSQQIQDGQTGTFEDLTNNDPVDNTINNEKRILGRIYQDMKNDPHYYLIVGSYTNEKKAKEFAQNIKEKTNHTPIVIYPPVGSTRPYRVSIYQSTDKAQVLRVKKQIERLKLKEIAAPWIYPNQR